MNGDVFKGQWTNDENSALSLLLARNKRAAANNSQDDVNKSRGGQTTGTKKQRPHDELEELEEDRVRCKNLFETLYYSSGDNNTSNELEQLLLPELNYETLL